MSHIDIENLDFRLLDLGSMHYKDAFDLQRELHAEVRAGKYDGVIILLEHPPVISLGAGTHEQNLLVTEKILSENGIELVKTDRGGDVTYHGPGQLVGYPIINLRTLGSDVHRFLRLIEEVVISTIGDFGIAGTRNGPAGVWAGDKKICSIGISVRGGVTFNGFALNVCPNLRHFEFINPCGLNYAQMTSLAMLVDPAPDMSLVRERVIEHFKREIASVIVRHPER
jgi:lipoate-protein ligase B